MTILYPNASQPHLTLPDEFDLSTSPLFNRIFENPAEKVVYLVEATPWSASAVETHFGPPLPPLSEPHLLGQSFDTYGGEVAIRLARETWRTRPGDAVLPDASYEGRISGRAFSISATLFEGLDPTSGGNSRGSEIEVLFDTSDPADRRTLDAWSRMGWDGRRLAIKAGLSWFDYPDFGPVAQWTIAGLSVSRNVARILPRDRGELFNRYLQQNFYGGSGGADGHQGLAGSPKPLGFGRNFNASPVLIDQTNWVYQHNDGPSAAVDALRDRGVALDFAGDYPSYASLVAATIPGGSYATCLAQSMERVGAEPAGGVTVDFRGDASGGYVETCGGILRRIVTTRLGARSLHDPEEIDAVAFSTLDALWSAPIGLYLTSQISAADAIRQIERSFYGTSFFTRDGRFSVKRFIRPAAGQFEVGLQKVEERRGIEVNYAPPPPWRVRVGFARNHTVQGKNDLAGAAEAVDGAMEIYGNEYRFHTAENGAVRTRHRLSETLEWPSLLALQEDAEKLASHILDFSDPPIRRYLTTVEEGLLRFWIGDEVTLPASTPGLGASRSGIVAAIGEQYGSGSVDIEVVA